MHFALASLALFLGATLARPSVNPVPASSSLTVIHNATEIPDQSLSHDEIHENVLASWPANLIISSDQLDRYLGDNSAEPFLIYLNDTRTWISTHESRARNSTLAAREAACVANMFMSYSSISSQSFWGPWIPVSDCFYNTDNSEANTQSMSFSESWSVSTDLGISSDSLADIISASFGITYTTGWSKTNTYSCTAPAYSISQIWSRHYYGWNAIKQQSWVCGISDGASMVGWGMAPVSQSSVVGCSTDVNVDCDDW